MTGTLSGWKQIGSKLVPLAAFVGLLLLTAAETARAQTETVLHSFTGGDDGLYPSSGEPLVRDAKGNLYGTTEGVPGTVFKITSTGKKKVLYRFTGGLDGNDPSGLVRDAQSNLYGTTSVGGRLGFGTVFQVTPSGKKKVIYSFGGSAADGASPVAGLLIGAQGNLYGTTLAGGASGQGTVFKVTPSGIETVLYSFAGADGAHPWATLIRDKAGNLYGTTYDGGAFGLGTVFKVSPTGIETAVYSFTGGRDGENPLGSLVLDAAGNLYGTAAGGGIADDCCGTVFKVTPTGKIKVLYRFTYFGDGAYPLAGLVRDAQGNLYGTTSASGASGVGVVFKVTRKGTETVLYSFLGQGCDPTCFWDGVNPQASLVRDAKGNLYGTTLRGGTSDRGTVFRLTP